MGKKKTEKAPTPTPTPAPTPAPAPKPAPAPNKGKGKEEDDDKMSVDEEAKKDAKDKEKERKAQMKGGGSSQASLREMTEDLVESADMLGKQIAEKFGLGGGDKQTSTKDQSGKGAGGDEPALPMGDAPNSSKGASPEAEISMGDADAPGADAGSDDALEEGSELTAGQGRAPTPGGSGDE